jgi:hypothetical protein
MYIRTILNRSDVNVVVDITSDESYVNSTALDWIQIPKQEVHIGDYFINNQIIHPEGEGYDTMVSPLIQQGEENYKLLNGISEPIYAAIEEETIDEQVQEEPTFDLQAMAAYHAQMAPPKIPTDEYDQVDCNIENFRIWNERANDTTFLVNTLKAGVGMVKSNNLVQFANGVTFPSGRTETFFLHQGTFEEYVAYLEQHKSVQINLVNRIRSVLENVNLNPAGIMS